MIFTFPASSSLSILPQGVGEGKAGVQEGGSMVWGISRGTELGTTTPKPQLHNS